MGKTLKQWLIRRCAVPLVGLAALASLSQPAAAGDLSDPAFRKQVSQQFPGVAPEDISPSPVPGLYRISQDGVVGYVTADGRYLLDGDLIDLQNNVNLSAQVRRDWRKRQIEKVGERNMLIFGPEDAAHTLTVFTDVDCAYCRQLHSRIDDITAAGIRVRYLFFPLHGPHSASFRKAEAVWCSQHPKQAFTRAMQGRAPTAKPDCDNPMAAQYRLAFDTLGLRGTPTILDEDGRILPAGLTIDGLIKKVSNAPVKRTASK